MSRLQIAIFILTFSIAFLSAQNANAQQMSDAEIDAMIEKQRRQIAVDAEGCRKYPKEDDEDVIIVCGSDPLEREQRIFTPSDDPDKIRRGEAVSTVRAGQCIGDFLRCGHQLTPFATTRFGYVKPMALDWDETMKGLPEPDMVITEDTLAAEQSEYESEGKREGRYVQGEVSVPSPTAAPVAPQ